VKIETREILLAFWKIHILHHASEGPVHGQWISTELRRHGYEISPGTLYPLLNRMARYGWLSCRRNSGGARARKDYRLTAGGRKVLALVREQIEDLHGEVGIEAKRKSEKVGRASPRAAGARQTFARTSARRDARPTAKK
jgi:DNA-binding PadR family transcriptional regulator